MFNIHPIVLGKLKESYWREAEAEYLKRLKPYAKIKITELIEEPFSDNFDPKKIKLIEASKIQKSLPKNGVIIALDEKGKKLSSVELANFISTNSTRGEELTFIIGGPLGLHESILKQANFQISLSSLTFTHQMARIILEEQIYRSVTILSNKRYHY